LRRGSSFLLPCKRNKMMFGSQQAGRGGKVHVPRGALGHDGRTEMSHIKSITAGIGLAAFLTTGTSFAAEPESCKAVHFADVGWTDITATTATASVVLAALGYSPDVQVLSVPVTYTSLKN